MRLIAQIILNKEKLEMSVEQLNTDKFESYVKEGTTLVDFWAPWCAPCQMQLPILDKVASKVTNGAKVAKLNIEESPEIASKFSIFSIPTLIVFKDGQPVKTLQGVQQENTLLEALA
jgi:thioredoxin 1